MLASWRPPPEHLFLTVERVTGIGSLVIANGAYSVGILLLSAALRGRPGISPRTAGLGYAVRQYWVPPMPVAMQVYVPAPTGIPATYQTQVAQVPGFFVTETTTGYVYPERWVIDQLNVGVYQWRKLPVQFVPR